MNEIYFVYLSCGWYKYIFSFISKPLILPISVDPSTKSYCIILSSGLLIYKRKRKYRFIDISIINNDNDDEVINYSFSFDFNYMKWSIYMDQWCTCTLGWSWVSCVFEMWYIHTHYFLLHISHPYVFKDTRLMCTNKRVKFLWLGSDGRLQF